MLARMINDYRPLLRLHNDMNRMVEEFLSDIPGVRPYAATWPAMNSWEDGDAAHIEAELPGLTMDDIEIYVTGNQLTVSGERKLGQEADRVNWHRRERAQGSFSRTMTLPWDINVEQVEAKLSDGVLTIRLPKAEHARPKKIKILTA